MPARLLSGRVRNCGTLPPMGAGVGGGPGGRVGRGVGVGAGRGVWDGRGVALGRGLWVGLGDGLGLGVGSGEALGEAPGSRLGQGVGSGLGEASSGDEAASAPRVGDGARFGRRRHTGVRAGLRRCGRTWRWAGAGHDRRIGRGRRAGGGQTVRRVPEKGTARPRAAARSPVTRDGSTTVKATPTGSGLWAETLGRPVATHSVTKRDEDAGGSAHGRRT